MGRAGALNALIETLDGTSYGGTLFGMSCVDVKLEYIFISLVYCCLIRLHDHNFVLAVTKLIGVFRIVAVGVFNCLEGGKTSLKIG